MLIHQKKYLLSGILFSIVIHFLFFSFVLNYLNLFNHTIPKKSTPLIFELVPSRPKIITKIKKKSKEKTIKVKQKNKPKPIQKTKPTPHKPISKTSIQTDTIKDIKMQFWLSQMESIWISHWSLQAQTLKYSKPVNGTIQATILRNGKIINIKIVTKSKYSQIDETAKRAIQRINRMPPIPSSYLKESYILNFIYHYAP